MNEITKKKVHLISKFLKKINNLTNYLIEHKSYEFIALILFIFTAFYVNYPDEYVNLLGGKALLSGKVAYKEFFDHHMPFAWVLSALIMILSHNSLLLFKFVWALLQFVFLWFMVGKIIEKYADKNLYKLYKYFVIIYPIVTMYFWLHLFLADSIASLLAAATIWLLVTFSLKQKVDKKDIYITGIFISFIVLTSLTYIYWAMFAYIWLLAIFAKSKPCLRCYLKFVFINALPYLLLAVYIIATNSIKEFIFSNFTYNTDFYISIPNYTKGRYLNPLKMLLTLIFNFWDKTVPVLARIGDLDLYFPHTQFFVLSALIAIYLLFKIYKLYGFLFFLMISVSAPRSEIINLGERNYQAGVFIMTATAVFFIILHIYNNIEAKGLTLVVVKTLLVVNIIYALSSFIFFSKDFYEKFFYVYTQKMPRNYDRDFTAEFVDEIIDNNDFFWIGPYEPHREFFVKKGQLPGKYPTLLPQFAESEFLKNDFIDQFEKKEPKIIIFKHTASIFMTPAEQFGAFFIDYLSNKYIRLSDTGFRLKKNLSDFDLKTDLYINKKYANEILERLTQKGYLE
ncbi:MAG: hypothetical protein KatS3mg090_0260 [Patescibacteria group bacterium]|nr:MAG: hypothetical protein KatS3mg090_0260 [Patescibacteria group bacterium]